MDWDDILQDTGEAFADTFGEDVIYTPYGGSARTIKAIVKRNPDAQIGPDGEALAPLLEITVENHATRGISTATMNGHGADKVTVAVRKGETARQLGVYLPPPGGRRTHDAGMISLDLR